VCHVHASTSEVLLARFERASVANIGVKAVCFVAEVVWVMAIESESRERETNGK
jgi:hypothetical protein